MAQSPETRDRILAAALLLFGTRGYRTSTIRELAAEVGLTSAALYYHFPSKEACLEALVAPYIADVEAVLDRHPAKAAPTQARRGELLADYLGVLVANPPLTRLIDRDPAVAGHREFGPRLASLVDGLLDRLAGTRGTADAKLRATAALGALRRPVLRTDIDVAERASELVDIALCAFEV